MEIKNRMEQTEFKKLVMVTDRKAITEKFRKMVECVFWGRIKGVIVYDMDTGLANEGEKWTETLKKHKSKTLPALVIKDSATIYEDMIRKLKTNITGNVTEDIKIIEKTRSGICSSKWKTKTVFKS